MRRRDLLALTGSLAAGLAGCLSTFGAGTPTGSGTRTDDQSETTPSDQTTTESESTTTGAADASVSVRTDALQPGVVTMTTPDSIGVGRSSGQYLFLDVTASGDVLPDREDFSFQFAGTTHRPVPVDDSKRLWRAYGEENWQYDQSGEGFLLFRLPASVENATTDAVEAALTRPGGEWTPDESVRRRLVTLHPPLSVSFEVSETPSVSEPPTVEVSVRNDGEVPGRFVAGVNRSGPRVAHRPVEHLSFLVPAGETKTWALADDSVDSRNYDDEKVGDGDPDMTYHLSWADDSLEREVRYVE
jgi:hypothetical protein